MAGNRDHILITGASGGIGRCLALEYANTNTRLSLWGRNSARLEEVAALCEVKGATVSIYSLDQRDLDVALDLLNTIDSQHPVSLAMFNAGVSSGMLPDGKMEGVDDVSRLLTVNASTTISLIAAMLARMQERGNGHIVGISSLAALYPLPSSPAYSASKVALAWYLRAVRPNMPPGIHVSLVYPGYVDTAMSRRLSGYKPMCWTPQRAATYIRSRLDKRKETIVFPVLLAAGTMVLHLLPQAVTRYFLKKFSFTVEPEDDSGGPASEAKGSQ